MDDRGTATVRRRRWPRWLALVGALLVAVALALAWLLQPARVTAWLLGNAGRSLKLDLCTSGPGHFVLRPGLRLSLPGLRVIEPGSGRELLHAERVDLALPWATLRGRDTAIGRIELQAPAVDLPALQAWAAAQPPSSQPLRLPTIRRGVVIRRASVRGRDWSMTDLDLDIARMADGQPLKLKLAGRLRRASLDTRFDLQATASKVAGVGQGLRVDGLELSWQGDAMLPSAQASGHLLLGERTDIDLRGTLLRIPAKWTAPVDSSFAAPAVTPFTLTLTHTPTPLLAAAGSTPAGWRLQASLGDAKRQPALKLQAHLDGEVLVDAGIEASLSRWPDAWPKLPAGLAGGDAPVRLHAAFRGPPLRTQPATFTLERGPTRASGSARLAEVRAWVRGGFATILPPLQGTLDTPQLEVGGVRLLGVHAELGDEAPPGADPRKP